MQFYNREDVRLGLSFTLILDYKRGTHAKEKKKTVNQDHKSEEKQTKNGFKSKNQDCMSGEVWWNQLEFSLSYSSFDFLFIL